MKFTAAEEGFTMTAQQGVQVQSEVSLLLYLNRQSQIHKTKQDKKTLT